MNGGTVITCLDTIQYVKGEISKFKLQDDINKRQLVLQMEEDFNNLMLKYSREYTLENYQIIAKEALAVLTPYTGVFFHPELKKIQSENIELPVISSRAQSFINDICTTKEEILCSDGSNLNRIDSILEEKINYISTILNNGSLNLFNKDDSALNLFEQNEMYSNILEAQYLSQKRKYELGLEVRFDDENSKLMQQYLVKDVQEMLLTVNVNDEQLKEIIQLLSSQIYENEFKDINKIFVLLMEAEKIKYNKRSFEKKENNDFSMPKGTRNVETNNIFLRLLQNRRKKVEDKMFGTKNNPIITLEKSENQRYKHSGNIKSSQYQIITRYKDENGKFIVICETILGSELDQALYDKILEERKSGIHPGISGVYISNELSKLDFKELYFEDYGVGFIFRIVNNQIVPIVYNEAFQSINISFSTFDSFEEAKNNNISEKSSKEIRYAHNILTIYNEPRDRYNDYGYITLRVADFNQMLVLLYKDEYTRTTRNPVRSRELYTKYISSAYGKFDATMKIVTTDEFGIPIYKEGNEKNANIENLIKGTILIDHKGYNQLSNVSEISNDEPKII